MGIWRTAAFAALSLGFLLPPATPLTAQDSSRVRADSSRPRAGVPAPPQATPAAAVSRVAPLAEPEVPRGPLAPGSRYTFTRDSLVWSSALTLSDLLGAIPGVFIARGGFVGQSEHVVYGGRGAAALEIYWDGVPLPSLGGDSVYADPARIYLTMLRRIDVEILPARLTVYLVSERHETLGARSVVRVMSGDYASSQYAGLFQKRWTTGLGLNLAANFVGSDGFSGPGRSDQAFDIWGRFEWLPTARSGAIYQVRRQSQDRGAVTVTGKGLVSPARHGVRTDSQLRIFTATPPGDGGLSAEFVLASSAWSKDSTVSDQGVRQASTTLRYAGRAAGVELTGRLADRWVQSALKARVGWVPIPGVILAGDAGLAQVAGDRSNRDAHITVAIYRGPFSAVGELAFQDAVQAPALPRDTAQAATDRAVRLGLSSRLFSGHVSLVRRDAYAPLPFPDVGVIAGFARTPRSTYLVADVRIRPIPPLTLDGWYANPRSAGVDFQPPHHARAQLTFRSKFWRTFRSGAFDLKVQAAVESWSRGRAGLSGGSPIELTGTSFWEAFISFQIVGLTAFWDLRNALNAREQYVPGLPYPRNAQTFGVRWEFFN